MFLYIFLEYSNNGLFRFELKSLKQLIFASLAGDNRPGRGDRGANSMEVQNKVNPNEQQMAEFMEPGHDEQIYMLNLLKFKEKASYEDNRETTLSGREAYEIYAKEVAEHLEKVGGKPVFGADVSRLMLGEVEDLWDMVAIAMYPNRKAMLQMITDADYQKSAEHRTAGLEGQLNIETKLGGF